MQLEPIQILLAVAAGIIFHGLLAASARRINPLMMVLGLYFILAPLSGAKDVPGIEAIKYARLYCSFLIVAVGVFLMRANRPRPAGLVFLLWAIFYMSAALYSPKPVNGLMLKGLYVLVVMSGLVAAYSIRSLSDLRIGLRVLLLGSGAFALLLLKEMVTNPSAVASIGRLVAFGLNPSRIGQECAPMIICASAVAFYDRSKPWRLLAYAVAAVLALATISSGSRGGTFMAAIGVFVCAMPLVKRPVLLAFTLAVVYFVGGFIISVVNPHATERLQDLSFETRSEPWRQAMDYFMDSPFIGQGWVLNEEARAGGGTQNMHSIYMQVIAETGLVGAFIFGVVVLYIALRAFRLFLFARSRHADTRYVYFTLGLTASLFAHGMAESSTIIGSNINAIMLPFALGMIDRLRELIAEAQPAFAEPAYRYDYAEEYGYGEGQLPASV